MTDASNGFTARATAQILDLPAETLRAWVKAGLVEPQAGPGGDPRFSWQDLALLRTAKRLSARVPARELRRALRALKAQRPQGTALGEMAEVDGHVVVREGAGRWAAGSGQGLLEFESGTGSPPIASLGSARPRIEPAVPPTGGEDWYALGCDLEPTDVGAARDAYRRALELDPDHADARINLGRLLHEAGHHEAAERHYRRVVDDRPQDPTAHFNLGVALEDLGRAGEAQAAYQQAIETDPGCADAHFNLSRLLERAGNGAAAFQHLRTYRNLTRAR